MKINSDMVLNSKQVMLNPAKEPVTELDDEKAARDIQLMKKSKQLEAVFLTQMIKSMEKTIPEGMGGGKNSLSSMMFSSVMGDAMSDGGGVGLSKVIYESLKGRADVGDLPELSGDEYLETMNLIQGVGLNEESR